MNFKAIILSTAAMFIGLVAQAAQAPACKPTCTYQTYVDEDLSSYVDVYLPGESAKFERIRFVDGSDGDCILIENTLAKIEQNNVCQNNWIRVAYQLERDGGKFLQRCAARIRAHAQN
jgi:hypothetical protein